MVLKLGGGSEAIDPSELEQYRQATMLVAVKKLVFEGLRGRFYNCSKTKEVFEEICRYIVDNIDGDLPTEIGDYLDDNFADWPDSARYLRPMKFFKCKGKELLVALAASPIRGLIVDLELSSSGLKAHDAAQIVRILEGGAIKRLNLYKNKLSDEGVRVLAESPHLAGLKSLDLGYNHLSDEGVRVLAESPHLTGLKSLKLKYNDFSDEGVRVLAESPHLAGLKSLDLGSNDLGDEGVRVLAESPHLAGLKSLDLNDVYLGDEGVRVLANSPHLAGLELLNLGLNGLSDVGARALAESPHLTGLKSLKLSKNRNITPEGGYALLMSKFLSLEVKIGLVKDEIIPDVMAAAYLTSLQTEERPECQQAVVGGAVKKVLG